MKYIKLFESFSGEKTKIEINLTGSNPDSEYGCTAVGVGNTPREAAMFVLQAACDWLTNVDSGIHIKDFSRFENTVSDYVEKDDLEEVLKMLEIGEIKTFEISTDPWGGRGESSFLSSHGDHIEADAYVEKALPGATIGGFILDAYVDEEGEDEEDEY
ncbi:MAG: hypothetical protein EBS19_03355 [Spirochaetia bacterium]|nr:hypothetical protein [Spirochaetia bacterium]